MVSYNASLNQNPFFKLSHKSNYLYNLYKSSEFKNKNKNESISISVANLFSHNKNSNFKHFLNKLYLEFKEHEPIINKINIDSTRVNVPYEVAKSKITHILKTIFSNTQYIDNTIVEYIDANINNCSMISYENTINEQIFTFNFIIYDNTKINIKKLNNCVKAMLLFLQVIINITNNKKVISTSEKLTNNICNSNGLQVNIFMTHFVKKFELYTNKVLGALNINTGLTYPCLKTGRIYIYRKHEFFKVFIHETLHSYNVDKLLHTNYEANSNFQSLIKLFNIAPSASSYKKIGLNEAITEFWAFLIHTFIYCYNNSVNFVKLTELFERFYKIEVNHSFFQVAKILHVNKLNYAQFLTTITKNSPALYNENSHVLSYIFFKSLLIYNVEKVLISNIFNFKLDSLKLDIKINPNNPIDDLFIMLRNYSLTYNTYSLINTSYTIYEKYISLSKSSNKKTIKKSQVLKSSFNKLLYKNKSHKSSSYVNYLLTNLSFMVIDYSCC